MAHLSRNLNLQLNFEREADATKFVKTKIVCTIGPKTNTVETLIKMIDAGMAVCRLNFSHGTHEYHGSVIDNVREAVSTAYEKRGICIMLDTKGPEIRTGKLADKVVDLVAGQKINVSIDNTIKGDSKTISLDYDRLCHSVRPGYSILVADGLISLTVESVNIEEGFVTCRVNNSAQLGETKNVHLPGAVVELPAVSEKDISDLKFGVEKQVDMVAASFIRKADDVLQIRQILGEHGKNIKIISKIESIEGLQNFDEILAVSDGIMVARGDLGVELPMEQIFLAQKMMISKCNAVAKPVITATQMLESMISNPRPTRAECTDVANAVLDGTDCVMLSGETAGGNYPLEAIRIMRKVCHEAELVERYVNYPNIFDALVKSTPTAVTDSEFTAAYAVRTANDLGAELLITVTDLGKSARFLSKYRPKVPVVAITEMYSTLAFLKATKAALPLVVENMNEKPTSELVDIAIAHGLELGIVKKGGLAVLLTGSEGKSTLTVRVLTIGESHEKF